MTPLPVLRTEVVYVTSGGQTPRTSRDISGLVCCTEAVCVGVQVGEHQAQHCVAM